MSAKYVKILYMSELGSRSMLKIKSPIYYCPATYNLIIQGNAAMRRNFQWYVNKEKDYVNKGG